MHALLALAVIFVVLLGTASWKLLRDLKATKKHHTDRRNGTPPAA